jgi:acyl-CoA synthetase (AMP-forming)/AMP-acid ligase II
VAAGASLGEDALRSFLRERLPRLMVPTVLVRLDSLPRGASGKIDRRRLPSPHAHGGGNGGAARPGGDP